MSRELSTSSAPATRPRVALLTEVASPYRLPVFSCLAADTRFTLRVFFLAEKIRGRDWSVSLGSLEFPYHILPGAPLGNVYGWPVFFNPGVLRALAGGNYDVIICGGYQHPTYWLAFAYAAAARKRSLVWSESTAKDQRSKRAVTERMKRLVVCRASGCIASGQAQAKYLESLGARGERIWLAPDAVDTRFFAEATQERRARREQIKQQLGLMGPVVLYVGRLIDEKGIPDLLEAFQRIRRTTDANLVLSTLR